ncbi:MAG TPA: hypothetical protein VGC76_18870 [Pyrinomonadaceae bacterium]|jgi:hypothetical protein
MPDKFFSVLFFIIFSAILTGGCAVEAARQDEKTQTVTKNSQTRPTIKIETNSPADTVRAFYKNLREKRFREAIFLTNLRPAIEGLTEAELKDLQVDFESLAQEVPAEIQINGEIITGDKATVTANLPDIKTNKTGIQQIKLRREGDVWIIQTLDEEAEKLVKKEGNKYFFAVRIEARQDEVKDMCERIMKAEMVFALQNEGVYGDLQALIQNNFVPADVTNTSTTGYSYKLMLSPDKKKYTVTAEPVTYGKTGKLSFLAEGEEGKNPRMESTDNGGESLKK